MKKVKVLVLRTAGTNCDKETKFAFEAVGAEADLVHINEVVSRKKKISSYQILAFPGGFSYGDDLGAGKILANELRFKLKKELEKFLKDGKLIIGICNGFQILVKAGLLPGYNKFQQEASLILNDSAKFEDRWTYLSIAGGKCIWTKNLPQVIYLPVAHGEGKFILNDENILEKIKNNNQIVFQYCNKNGGLGDYPENPNGSVENIAGICDESGRILGLMPHPERHISFYQHPHWTRLDKKEEGDGLAIFRNGVEYAKENL
ncbi:MAG: phosphoribosylformylglycinamidine synthase I [Candidatus Omnitrophica bacterium]|nr:phosphoribosylformylglycinamidine synthase I [Candidatus Omnitrophota bacterium]MDD5352910.1 phosphoribosylformylglycinamidine synthase I [Candidatus Omnitrophota bacterium]MDD5550509.1 phosphoribosylformylglycinamidine synthase I [Candidatus Omnitrophota bacterium]